MTPILCPMCGQESSSPRCGHCGEQRPLPRGACVLCGGRPARNLTLSEPFALRFAASDCEDCHGQGRKTDPRKLPRRSIPCTCLSSGRVCSGCRRQLSRAIPLVRRLEGGPILLVLIIFSFTACLLTGAVWWSRQPLFGGLMLFLAGVTVFYPSWERSRAAPAARSTTEARLRAVAEQPALARLIEVLSQYRLTLLNASELHGLVTQRINALARSAEEAVDQG